MVTIVEFDVSLAVMGYRLHTTKAKLAGNWLIAHVSVPLDLEGGRAVLNLEW